MIAAMATETQPRRKNVGLPGDGGRWAAREHGRSETLDLDAAAGGGRCPHSGVVGYLPDPVFPGQAGLGPGQWRCCECGRVFESFDDWLDAMDGAV